MFLSTMWVTAPHMQFAIIHLVVIVSVRRWMLCHKKTPLSHLKQKLTWACTVFNLAVRAEFIVSPMCVHLKLRERTSSFFVTVYFVFPLASFLSYVFYGKNLNIFATPYTTCRCICSYFLLILLRAFRVRTMYINGTVSWICRVKNFAFLPASR